MTAWENALETGNTPLTLAMISLLPNECVLDPQCEKVSRTFFCKVVEMVMRRTGDIIEADLCLALNTWTYIDDKPSVPAVERCWLGLFIRVT